MTTFLRQKYQSIDICSVFQNERKGNNLRKFIHLICDDNENEEEKIQRGNEIYYAFVEIRIYNVNDLNYSIKYGGCMQEVEASDIDNEPIFRHFLKMNGRVCSVPLTHNELVNLQYFLPRWTDLFDEDKWTYYKNFYRHKIVDYDPFEDAYVSAFSFQNGNDLRKFIHLCLTDGNHLLLHIDRQEYLRAADVRNEHILRGNPTFEAFCQCNL